MPLVDVAALAVVVLAGAAIYAVLRASGRPGGASISAWVAVTCMVLAVLVVGGQLRATSTELVSIQRELEGLREELRQAVHRSPATTPKRVVLGSEASDDPDLATREIAVEHGESETSDDTTTPSNDAFEPILAHEPREAVDGTAPPEPSTWARLKDAFQGLEGPGHVARRGSIELGGGAGGSLPIRVFGQDLIEVRVFNHAGHELSQLEGLALKVGARRYPLLDSGGRYSEQQIRVPGDVKDEVSTALENPGELSGVTVRLLARSVQPVRARRSFELLLGDPTYRAAAREHFRVANTDALRLRAAPNLESEVHDKLDEGSYVLVLREAAEGWSEVETPAGQRGFIKGEFLSALE